MWLLVLASFLGFSFLLIFDLVQADISATLLCLNCFSSNAVPHSVPQLAESAC